ncbi:hypothetical protein WN51_01853 [Melipona quadrifasciata]|uniref:Uncharacterized protein n=1 Tax=Melipona quadrifasciata TaxID=166423 RepID=A0A0M8ZWN6_9HYME|nr:hypothetical protein WN51_01853 [Melipona quadrifasciata]
MQKRQSYNRLLLWTEKAFCGGLQAQVKVVQVKYSTAIAKGYCQTCLCSTQSGTFKEIVG